MSTEVLEPEPTTRGEIPAEEFLKPPGRRWTSTPPAVA